MSDTSKELRADFDSRRQTLLCKSVADKVVYYRQNPRAFFVDRQFAFGSAGRDYQVMVERAMNRAARYDDEFSQRIEAHVAVALHRLDAIRVVLE